MLKKIMRVLKQFKVRMVIPICVFAALLLGAMDAYADTGTGECERCSAKIRKAELIEIMRLYREEVQLANDSGYLCGNHPDFIDLGDGNHTPGNCADWAQITWRALVVRKWECWKIVKVKARHKFWLWEWHNFIYITPKCGGEKIYLDPFKSGRPDMKVEEYFNWKNSFWGGWIYYPVKVHKPGDPPIDPGSK